MNNDNQALFDRFDELGIQTTTFRHKPVFTVQEAQSLRGSIKGGHCKNLFLKDNKGQLWLLVCLEEAQINLKTLPARIGSKRLSFGKPELLMEVLGVNPGSVTPYALINDKQNRVNVVLDEKMMAMEILNYHPLQNDATTSIRSDDLLKFINSCGHSPQITCLDEAD